MTFGTEWGWGTDEPTARRMFDAYLDRGGNFIDTADLYTNGTSEQWLGRFVTDCKVRDRVVIATKFSFNAEPGNPNAGGNGRKNMLRAIDGSLRRLGTDYVDLYLVHVWDGVTEPDEVMRTFDDLVRAGKVRYAGLSDVPAWYASRAQAVAEFRGLEPACALQLEYSLVQRAVEDEFVPLGTRYGMGLMCWSPLAGGMLSGKYKPSQGKPAEGEGRLKTVEGSNNPSFPKWTERNWAIVEELEQVANQLGRSMAQVAVNWVANRPGVASVIVGATKLPQLEDNLTALDFSIPRELAERLDRVSRPEVRFPYTFFGPEIQGMVHGGKAVGDKPRGYWPHVGVQADGGAGVT
jgi:aryl-alcohol dehydrogenase-like predicted oxidoreductase